MEEVVSSFEDCQGWKQKEVSETDSEVPSQQISNPQGVEPLGGEGEKPLWKEAWPR